MQIKSVVVSGPNGTLGPPVIASLVKAGFKVTALSRSPEKTKASYPGIDAKQADYGSVDDLTNVLQSIKPDAVVCLINRHAYQEHVNLIDACLAAGVPHIIPSSFGVHAKTPEMRSLPPAKEKVMMEDYLIRKADSSEGRLTYTMINTSLFFDWAMKLHLILNLKNDGQPSKIFNSGDVRVSGAALDDIGLAVANALRKRDQLVNRICSIHSTVYTQNQLLAYARELAPDRIFETVTVDTAELQRQAQVKLDQGDRSPWALRPFILHMTFGKGLSVFEEVDNEILEVPIWSEERVKSLMKEITGG